MVSAARASGVNCRVSRRRRWQQLRIPRDFPEMRIRILEVPRVPAVERVCRRFDDGCPRACGPRHHSVDLGARPHVVGEAEVRGRRWADGKAAVVRQACAGPQGEAQPAFELEERDCPILEFPTDDAVGGPAKTAVIELHGTFQIADPEGDECDAWFHRPNRSTTSSL